MAVRTRRRAPAEDDDGGIMGLEGLGTDPAPRATRTRAKRAASTPAAPRTGNRGKIAARTSSGKIMSKAAMIEKVSLEIHMYATLAVAGWELRDQIGRAHV